MPSGTEKSLRRVLDESSSASLLTQASVFSAQFAMGNILHPLYAEYHGYITDFGAKRADYQAVVDQRLSADPTYTGHRDDGVRLAWMEEQAIVRMGGDGTRAWTPAQKEELLRTGRVTEHLESGETQSLHGHHINNVEDHPYGQANPDNIEFVTESEHYSGRHAEGTRTPTEGETLDRFRELRRANTARVIKAELTAAGITAAAGFFTGMTISLAIDLAKNGFSAIQPGELLKNAARAGAVSAGLALVSYTGSRLLWHTINGIAPGWITSGLLPDMITGGIVSLSVTAAYQYWRLKKTGITGTALTDAWMTGMRVPALTAVASCLAQGIWGGAAGVTVACVAGLTSVGARIIGEIHDRGIRQQLEIYAVEQYRPPIFVS